MKNVILKIKENKQLSNDIYLMKLEGDLSEIKKPGEFVEIKLDNYYLRRPISVHNYSKNELTLLYKVLGRGTNDLSKYQIGKELDVLVGLGNGFDISKSNKPLLIAGGIGIAPMYNLALKFNKLGIKPTLIYGVSRESDLVLIDEFSKICNLIICSDDGSQGFKGNVVSYLKENKIDFDKYYACGPQVMLKYLKQYSENGYVSLEARMGCGFGACMGCSIETTHGPKRVCKEGPVFEASEVLF
jgi:dihydroorotate dehydrogenase electron transfer subunit